MTRLTDIRKKNKKKYEDASPDQKALYLRDYKKVLSIQKEVERKLLKNAIMDVLLKTVTKPVNRERMATPIVMELFNNLENPNSLAAYLSSKGLWPEEVLTDLSTPEDAYAAFESMRGGALLTGAFANIIKALSYMSTASATDGMPNIKEKFRFDYKVGSKTITFDKLRNKEYGTGEST